MNKANLIFIFRWTACRIHPRLHNTSERKGIYNSFCTSSEADIVPNCGEQLSIQTFSDLLTTRDRKQQIREIIDEYHKAREKGHKVPESLNSEQMYDLLEAPSRTQRLKCLSYFFKKEKIKLSVAKEKEEKRLKKESGDSENIEVQPAVGRINKTTFLRHIRKPSITRFHNLRLAHASLLSPKLILDLSYEEFMLRKEIRNCVKQLNLAFSANRRNRYPFDMYVCNVKPDSFSAQCLKKEIPRYGQVNCLDTFTELSYLDLFPRERLIYLSPHANETMREYDPSSIYIIGAFVDLSSQWKISSEKAEQEGLRSLSLPLEDYVQVWHGSKCLSMNQVYEILLHMKNTGDWRKSLRAIPKRKVGMERPAKEEAADHEINEKIVTRI